MTTHTSPGELLRSVRADAALSQRALAHRSATSGPAIAAYESGSKVPSWETLRRVCESAGYEVELRAVPARLTRNERRSLAIHAAIGDRLDADPDGVLRHAKRNLRRLEEVHADGSADVYLDAWAQLLDGPIDELRTVLHSTSEQARTLRHATPFAGVLTDEERRAVLAEVR